jgi:hypothetical protein
MAKQPDTTESQDDSITQLGPIISEYPQDPMPPRMFVLFCAAWALIGFALIWAGRDLGFPLQVEDVFLVLFCLSCMAGGFGLAALFYYVRKVHGGDTVIVHEQGLVQRVKGRQVSCAWEDIETAYCGEVCKGWRFVRSRHPYYKLVTYGGLVVQVSSRTDQVWWGRFRQGMDSLGECIESNIQETLVPKLVQRLQAGDRVEFEGLSADLTGIHSKNGVIPWSNVKAFTKRTLLINGVGDTEIVLEEVDSQFGEVHCTMFQLPNLAALIQMHHLMAGGP